MVNLIPVDVICQHSKDGTIFPIRIRVTDEDGLQQTFSVKGYRDLTHQGTRTTQDGVYVTDNTIMFECKIEIIDRIRTVRLYYNNHSMIWKMAGGEDDVQ